MQKSRIVASILILAAIAGPKMDKQIKVAREMAAIRLIGTIHQAETQYYAQFGHYTENLTELGPPANGNVGGYLFKVPGSPTKYCVTFVRLGEPVRWNYAASFLCILAAVGFAFWGK